MYEPFGDVNSLTYANGIITHISYDYRGEPKEIKAEGEGKEILNITYTMDKVGSITEIKDLLDPSGDQAYSYDSLNRLVSGYGGYGDFSYIYDDVGNRLSMMREKKETTYTYESGSNRLISYNDPLRAWAWAPNDGGSSQGRYERTVQDVKKEVFDICGEGFGRSNLQVKKGLIEFLLDVKEIINKNGLPEIGITRGNLFRIWLKEESTRGYIKEILNAYLENPLREIEEEECDLLKGFVKSAQKLNIFKILESNTDVYYDLNGNVVRVGEDVYHHDYLNRLTAVTSYEVLMGRYFYDYMNRRVLKQSFGIEIIYLYDIYGNLISEYDAESGTLIRDYIYIGNRPIAMIRFTPLEPQPPSPTSGCVYVGYSNRRLLLLILTPIFLFLVGYCIKERHFKRVLIYVIIYSGMTGIIAYGCLEDENERGSEMAYNGDENPSNDADAYNVDENPSNGDGEVLNPSHPSGTEDIYYYHTDHLGSPLMMTDKDGNIVWEMRCSPFQETCSIKGDVYQPLRFPGQYHDEESGLHYNWHRYYRPDWGRYGSFHKFTFGPDDERILFGYDWLSFLKKETGVYIDFLSPSFEIENIFNDREIVSHLLYFLGRINPDLFNGYVYVRNNPIRNMDKEGEEGVGGALLGCWIGAKIGMGKEVCNMAKACAITVKELLIEGALIGCLEGMIGGAKGKWGAFLEGGSGVSWYCLGILWNKVF